MKHVDLWIRSIENKGESLEDWDLCRSHGEIHFLPHTKHVTLHVQSVIALHDKILCAIFEVLTVFLL